MEKEKQVRLEEMHHDRDNYDEVEVDNCKVMMSLSRDSIKTTVSQGTRSPGTDGASKTSATMEVVKKYVKHIT